MHSAYGYFMAHNAPYLQRRGYGLTFRIGVPQDLRLIVEAQEITKALLTADKNQAAPLALHYAAFSKRMFFELRTAMKALQDDEERQPGAHLELLKEAARQLKHRMQVLAMQDDHQDELIAQRSQHLKELEMAKLQAENRALMAALTGRNGSASTVILPAPERAAAVPVPTLKDVVDGFLAGYEKTNRPQMLKKHRPVLTMLLELVGNKSVDEILQDDINKFFDVLGRLPPRWSYECRKRKLTIRELAALDHPKRLGPKSLEDTYIASLRPFLIAAKRDWQDQGFPLGLTVDGVQYLGDEEEGVNKQRSFTQVELERLFGGVEMKKFAADKDLAHYFWLCHLGLFTGARVNEICQLNPQTDILQEPETGLWYFWFNEDTPADNGIVKSIKTGDSRKVPFHSTLVELGFVEYITAIKAEGARRLFPAWEPINRRASGNAEKWFRQFLRDTGLRDDTPKSKITGMHAFRHTILTHGAMQKPPLSLFCITGHVQDEAPIHATGAGRGYLTLSMLSSLSDKASLINKLNYGITFQRPSYLDASRPAELATS